MNVEMDRADDRQEYSSPVLSDRVLAVSVEGIAAWFLGNYGSSSAETPFLDTLAATGIVLDQCYLDSRNPMEMLYSLWTANHAASRNAKRELPGSEPGSGSLWRALKLAGWQMLLITDCDQAANLAESLGCEQVQLVEPEPVSEPATESSQCAIFSLFMAAAQSLEVLNSSGQGKKFCWIHSRGLGLPWDSPLELRQRFKDSEDPDPPSSIQAPVMQIDATTDPDVVTGWTQVAAAQICVLDDALQLLDQVLEESGANWSWCFIGLNGYPLGERGTLGWHQNSISNHQVQCTVIIHPNPAPPIGWRHEQLSQLPDVGATIADLCQLELGGSWGISLLHLPQDESPANWSGLQQLACLVEDDLGWVRSPAWSMTTRNATGDHASAEDGSPNMVHELFVMPDDRWEVNEVSNRCEEVVRQLYHAQSEFLSAAQAGNRRQLRQLDRLLCDLQR